MYNKIEPRPLGLFEVIFTYVRNVLKLTAKVKINHQIHVTLGAAAE
jgi:hypothetical protein